MDVVAMDTFTRLERWLSGGIRVDNHTPYRAVLCAMEVDGYYRLELYEYIGRIWRGEAESLRNAIDQALDLVEKYPTGLSNPLKGETAETATTTGTEQ